MNPKNWTLEGKNLTLGGMRGGGGGAKKKKNQTSFMDDPILKMQLTCSAAFFLEMLLKYQDQVLLCSRKK